MSVVIYTDCIGWCKSNYHRIADTTILYACIYKNQQKGNSCTCLFFCIVSLTPAIFYWSVCTTPGEWAVILLCFSGINFDSISIWLSEWIKELFWHTVSYVSFLFFSIFHHMSSYIFPRLYKGTIYPSYLLCNKCTYK
jgi:hypothetical protein